MNTDPSAMQYESLANPIGSATLDGYHLEFAYFATIAKGGTMQGALWEIDEHTLKQLDKREGYPEFYTRFVVPVTIDETNEIVNAIVYQMTPGYVEFRVVDKLVSDYYLDMLRSGYTTFGIPLSQINRALNT
jgi:gamma-glutamylcyclotransferase (GGCT)/AIG2-like uncharacterized protein YtfP